MGAFFWALISIWNHPICLITCVLCLITCGPWVPWNKCAPSGQGVLWDECAPSGQKDTWDKCALSGLFSTFNHQSLFYRKWPIHELHGWVKKCVSKMAPFLPWLSLFTLASCIVLALWCPWCSIIVVMVMWCGIVPDEVCVLIPNACNLLSWCLAELSTDGLCWEFVPYFDRCAMVCASCSGWSLYYPASRSLKKCSWWCVRCSSEKVVYLRWGGEQKKHLPSRLLYLESPGGSCLMVELLIPDDGFTPSEWQCLPGSIHWAYFPVFSQGCWLCSP